MKYFAGVVSLAWVAAATMILAAEPVQDAGAALAAVAGAACQRSFASRQSLRLSSAKNKNVKWRVKVPGKGHSTPVVWGDRIFLTTAVRTESPAAGGEYAFVVIALDRDTGKKIWERTALVATPHEGYHRQYGSFASNSPVTDGKMLYAYFGSRGIFAYDLDGNLKWKKALPAQLHKRHAFGEGTAPVLHKDVLLLNCDQEAQSFLLALDKRNGEQLWRRDRDELSTWTPPLVVEHAGRKQVVVGGRTARSYDLETGELIWQAAGTRHQPDPGAGSTRRHGDSHDGPPQPESACRQARRQR